jgi:hypothetical protein
MIRPDRARRPGACHNIKPALTPTNGVSEPWPRLGTTLSRSAAARWNLQERINPGYLQRSEQRERQKSGIQYLVSPARLDRYIAGGR